MTFGMYAAAAVWAAILWLGPAYIPAGIILSILPAQNSSVADVTPAGCRSRGYGLYQTAAGLGAIIGPPLGTPLYTPQAALPAFALASGVFVLAGLLGLAAAPTKRKNS